jgi:hypothetical protein
MNSNVDVLNESRNLIFLFLFKSDKFNESQKPGLFDVNNGKTDHNNLTDLVLIKGEVVF